MMVSSLPHLQNLALTILSLMAAINAPSFGATKRAASAETPQASSQRGRGRVSAMSLQEERNRVEEAANRFVRRFHETLDFGTVFDEMAASNAIQILRKGGFFSTIGISPQLVAQLDDSTLRRLYKAYMNEYYKRFAYDLSVEPLSGPPQGGSLPPPPEVTAAIEASKYRPLLSAGWSGDLPTLTTPKEVEEYIAGLNKIAGLYRAHLSKGVFDSQEYKAAVRRVNKFRAVDFDIRQGLPELGIGENTKIYVLEKDIFVFLFVEENGALKVLTFSTE